VQNLANYLDDFRWIEGFDAENLLLVISAGLSGAKKEPARLSIDGNM
jgi:hypothetical protein